MKTVLFASTMLTLSGAAFAQTTQSASTAASQQYQAISPGQQVTDTSGNVWAITASGSITENGQWTPGGGGTKALTVIGGRVYGEDASGRGWFVLSGDGQSWTTTAAPTLAGNDAQTATQTSTQTSSNQATTTSLPCNSDKKFGVLPLSDGGAGVILDANGQKFVPRGINVMNWNTGSNPSAATLKATFPGINFIRLAIYNYDSPDSLAPYVNDLTSNGIVVELEDHNNGAGNAGGSQGQIFTGQQLTTELGWYSSVAEAFKNNPYVWFGTNNEPSEKNASGGTDPSALSNWQLATYEAVRSAGNNGIVMLETTCWAEGGQPVCNQGYDPSVYSQMNNVIWDNHVYGWLTNGETDQAKNDQFVAANVAALSSIKSAGGVTMPVLIGEYGNSTTGEAIDGNGTQIVNAVQKTVMSGTAAGSSAWAWGSGNPGDGLTTGGSGLSDYGQQVASYIAQPVQGGSVAITCGGTSTSQAAAGSSTSQVAQNGSPANQLGITTGAATGDTPNNQTQAPATPNPQIQATASQGITEQAPTIQATDSAVQQAISDAQVTEQQMQAQIQYLQTLANSGAPPTASKQ